jgi:glycosyltransferase involved in cell wall biosynthesis
MKVINIGTGFASVPPTGAFATERTIHYLSAAIMSLGHDVTVLDIENNKRPAVPYTVEEVRLSWRRDVDLYTHALRGFAFRAIVRAKLRELLQRQNVDIVNFNNQFSAWHIPLARKYGAKIVYSLHNALWYDAEACHSGWQKLKFFQELRAIRLADMVICQNETTCKNLTEILGIPQGKLIAVPLGISIDWFEQAKVSDKIRNRFSPNSELLILHVARIAPYKNQLTLVRAMSMVVKEVANARLVFVGPVSDSSYFGELQKSIVRAGLESHVVFAGEIPHKELPEIYALSQVFACPSLTEAFGIVVMEAMAQGTAIVASDIETFRSMLSDGRGLTVPPFDHEALANAIIDLLQNKSQREEMGRRAREYVKANYTWHAVAKKTTEAYAKLNFRETLS